MEVKPLANAETEWQNLKRQRFERKHSHINNKNIQEINRSKNKRENKYNENYTLYREIYIVRMKI